MSDRVDTLENEGAQVQSGPFLSALARWQRNNRNRLHRIYTCDTETFQSMIEINVHRIFKVFADISYRINRALWLNIPFGTAETLPRCNKNPDTSIYHIDLSMPHL